MEEKKRKRPPPWAVRDAATTAASNAIIDDEVAKRDAKMERLRKARESQLRTHTPPLVSAKKKRK